MTTAEARRAGPAKWRGKPGRLEVWYATLTDPATGDGWWLHHEVIAPTDGGAPYGQGWLARFREAGGAWFERFGPAPSDGPASGGGAWFAAAGAIVDDGRLTGVAGPWTWDLHYEDDAPPLYPFPRWAWERNALPGAQMVLAPTASFAGRIEGPDGSVEFTDARGAVARIYGHGNAERWGWLHADLGGDDVLEVVAAVSRTSLLRRLPPVAMLRLRLGGHDWPGGPFPPVPGWQSEVRLGLPEWSVEVRRGRRRVRATVTIPADRAVVVPYDDPGGAGPTCTNSERADALVVLERRDGRGWMEERRWELAATAHAEVGRRG